ncbi:SURF1 family protein [Janibacter terrae]|uniref:SURF1 family protein n=1 Tax=Janibacter terrae TaxID=103817 RepID=UPI0008366560|nr:SURF1 family protein [Janibacter terrae]MBA4083407.1 SURF1 family protein [Kytococcus sp.]
MLRTAARPRWLGLLVVALVLVALGITAGRWQWSVAHDEARADAVREVQDRPVRPLADVVAPHEGFPDDGSGQRVSTRGEYVGDPLRILDRRLDGRPVEWVLDRFVVAESGANLPVVRGWVPEGEDAPAAPSGTIELVGSLAPAEAPDETGGVRDGELTSVDVAQLVNVWPGEIYNGFAFAVTEDGTAEAKGVQRVPPPLPDTSLQWRNVMYAFQWWMFSVFALWMWVKMVRQAARPEQTAAAVQMEEST